MFEISIIIPVYNVEKYLNSAFDSILSQTFGFENLEVIFVDDCSSDNSFNIIKSFSDAYENVKLIQLEENSGYSGRPRNVGIKSASSDYIMFLDPDDEFLPNACEDLFKEIANKDISFASGNFIQSKNGNENKINWKDYFSKDTSTDRIFLKDIDENIALCKLPPSIWTKIFKKDFLIDNDIYFPEDVPGQDLVFIFEALIKAENILYVDIPVTRYMIRESNSITTKISKKSLISFIDAYNMVYDLVIEFNKDYVWLAARPVSSFFFQKFIECDLKDVDKVDVLKYTEKFFGILVKSKELNLPFNQRLFFEYCNQKRYWDAVTLSKSISYNKTSYSYQQELKYLKIFVVCDCLEDINKFKQLFDSKEYELTFINCNDSIKEDNVINLNEYYDNYQVSDEGKVSLNKTNPDLTLTFNSLDEFNGYIIEDIIFSNNQYLLIVNSNINLINVKYNKIVILDSSDLNIDANAIIVQNDKLKTEFENNGFDDVYLIKDIFSKDYLDEWDLRY